MKHAVPNHASIPESGIRREPSQEKELELRRQVDVLSLRCKRLQAENVRLTYLLDSIRSIVFSSSYQKQKRNDN